MTASLQALSNTAGETSRAAEAEGWTTTTSARPAAGIMHESTARDYMGGRWGGRTAKEQQARV